MCSICEQCIQTMTKKSPVSSVEIAMLVFMLMADVGILINPNYPLSRIFPEPDGNAFLAVPYHHRLTGHRLIMPRS